MKWKTGGSDLEKNFAEGIERGGVEGKGKGVI